MKKILIGAVLATGILGSNGIAQGHKIQLVNLSNNEVVITVLKAEMVENQPGWVRAEKKENRGDSSVKLFQGASPQEDHQATLKPRGGRCLVEIDNDDGNGATLNMDFGYGHRTMDIKFDKKFLKKTLYNIEYDGHKFNLTSPK